MRLLFVIMTVIAACSGVAIGQLNIVGNFQSSGSGGCGISYGLEPTTSLSGGGSLLNIFDAAANWWERALPGLNSTVVISYGWAPRTADVLATACTSTSDYSSGNIGFDNDGTSPWYMDPVPEDAREFFVSRVDSETYGGVTINTSRQYVGGIGADFDLLSVAIHEIGHVLGARSAGNGWGTDSMDGDIDVNVGGFALPIPAIGGHLNVPGALMSPSVSWDTRQLPTTADILAIADVRGVANFDLTPSGGTIIGGGGDFHHPASWSSGTHPDPMTEVGASLFATQRLSFSSDGSAGSLAAINSSLELDLNSNDFTVHGRAGIDLVSPSAPDITVIDGTLHVNSGRVNADSSRVQVSGSSFRNGVLRVVDSSVSVRSAVFGSNGILTAANSSIDVNEYLIVNGQMTTDGGSTFVDEQLIADDGGTITVNPGSFVQVLGRTGDSLYVGNFGNGILNQNGGTIDLSTPFYVGIQSTGSGTYNISGGDVQVYDNMFVAVDGRGRVNHSGSGDVFVNSNLIIAANGSGDGEYVKTGGVLDVAASTLVGSSGTGHFSQSAGTTNIGNELIVGNIVGSNGTLQFNGGVINVDQGVFIGNFGNGVATQTNGTLTALSGMFIGTAAGSFGDYTISDGRINAALWIGSDGNGRFAQLGGVVETSAVRLGIAGTGSLQKAGGILDVQGAVAIGHGVSGTGQLDISGGEMLISQGLFIGNVGTGIYGQTGGYVEVAGTTTIGQDPGSIGTMTLSGGTFQSQQLRFGSGTGNFVFNGGRLEASSIEFELNQSGGTLTPSDRFLDINGNETGDTSQAVLKIPLTIDGNLNVDAGSLELELHGAALSDQVVVNGSVDLESTTTVLSVIGTGGYAGPDAQGEINLFTLVLADEIAGNFSQSTFNGVEMGHISGSLFADIAVSATTIDLQLYNALPGDANGDGTVDVSDFNVWNANKFMSDTTWFTGDFNGDGVTDAADFNVWNANKFTSVPQRLVVPEPSLGASNILLLLTYCVAWRRRLTRSARTVSRREER